LVGHEPEWGTSPTCTVTSRSVSPHATMYPYWLSNPFWSTMSASRLVSEVSQVQCSPKYLPMPHPPAVDRRAHPFARCHCNTWDCKCTYNYNASQIYWLHALNHQATACATSTSSPRRPCVHGILRVRAHNQSFVWCYNGDYKSLILRSISLGGVKRHDLSREETHRGVEKEDE
jgi:hypothetical protein